MAEALLLVETESFAAVTVTVLVMFPVEDVATVARIVTIADSPGANAGMTTLAVLFAPDETVPAGVEPIKDVPETNVTPVGKVSATFTVDAVEGPLFVTVKVYVISLPACMLAGPLLVIATSFCCVSVVVTDAELFVLTVSVEAESVVLITALFTKAVVEFGNIAATMVIVLFVAADANAPTGKIKSSGFEAVKSDAVAGMVMEVPLMVAVMTRIPSGILSTT